MKNSNTLKISVVVPVYNEESVIEEFHMRLISVFNTHSIRGEILYVNDGSTDKSFEILNNLQKKDKRIGILELSRNFGKEIALTAGLDHANGDAIVVIDSDLQDPPELILDLIKNLQEGYDVVYAKRISRKGETILKKLTAFLFYRFMQNVGELKLPADTGDYRILSRRAVEALKQFREQHRFMKGLFAWIGYPQKSIPYERDPRFGGVTKWNYWKLWNFALEGLTSFTIAPLKLASYFGFFTAFAAFIYAAIIIFKTLAFGDPVAGYPSLVVIVLFLGGIQLIFLGIIGEYLGRTFNEGKHRPLYFLQTHIPSDLESLIEPDSKSKKVKPIDPRFVSVDS